MIRHVKDQVQKNNSSGDSDNRRRREEKDANAGRQTSPGDGDYYRCGDNPTGDYSNDAQKQHKGDDDRGDENQHNSDDGDQRADEQSGSKTVSQGKEKSGELTHGGTIYRRLGKEVNS
jgi:hypothetical protein